MNVVRELGRIRKALVAFFTAGLPLFLSFVVNGNGGMDMPTAGEWAYTIGAALVAFFGVYGMTNDPPQNVSVPAVPVVPVVPIDGPVQP